MVYQQVKGYVSSESIFKQTIMDLNAREGAEINIKLDAQKSKCKAVTGGIIELSGEAVNQDATIMSGGVLKSRDYFSDLNKGLCEKCRNQC
jgi:hypothetical protein